jgi:hypothetical protein
MVLPDLQQVIVSGHEVFRSGRQRAVKDAVISRIVFDDIYRLLRVHMPSERLNLLLDRRNVLIRPFELEAQDALYLRHYRVRHCHFDHAGARQRQKLKRFSPEVEARDKNISIRRDPEHYRPCSARDSAISRGTSSSVSPRSCVRLRPDSISFCQDRSLR